MSDHWSDENDTGSTIFNLGCKLAHACRSDGVIVAAIVRT